MRTSGSPTEARLTAAILFVAFAIAVMLMGGPREFMLIVDRALRSVADLVFTTWQNVRA